MVGHTSKQVEPLDLGTSYIFPTIRTVRKLMRQQAYCDSKASWRFFFKLRRIFHVYIGPTKESRAPITLKTDLCDNGWSRLINIDHKLIMLDQRLGRDASHDCAKMESSKIHMLSWSTLTKRKNDQLWSIMIKLDQPWSIIIAQVCFQWTCE